MSSFAILRVSALNGNSRGSGSVGGACRHLDNHKEAAEISRPELSQYNRNFMLNPPTFMQIKERASEMVAKHNEAVDEWNKTHDKPKRRHLKKGTNQFFEVVATYSPEMEGKIDRAEWCRETLKFLKETFIQKGCVPLRSVFHADEETGHIQAVFLAYDNETQKAAARDVLGGRADLCRLQDEYADAMKQFGLERGYSRYREYESIKKRAEAQNKTIEEYAEEHNLELPKFRAHKSIREWKAEQHALGMTLERKVTALRNTVDDLETIKKQLGNAIPSRYLEVVEACESYEKLLEIGKQIPISIEGHEMSITDFLIEARNQDLKRIQKLNEEMTFSL